MAGFKPLGMTINDGDWNKVRYELQRIGSFYLPILHIDPQGVISRDTDTSSDNFGVTVLHYNTDQFDALVPAGYLHIMHFHTPATGRTCVGVDTENGGGNYCTSVGYTAGRDVTGANGTFIGAEAGIHVVGNDTTCIGYRAGTFDTGANNTHIGKGAGYVNTGTYDVLIGEAAGHDNAGDGVVSIGRETGFGNTGDNNLFIGYKSGYACTGNYEVCVGASTGWYATGSYCTLIGYAAGQNNIKESCTFIGYNAGTSNTGTEGIFLGYGAGASNTGNGNIIIGFQAGAGNTGSSSVIIGFQSGYGNTGNGTSVIIGYQAGTFNTGNGCVILGYQAGLNNATSNRFIVSNSNSATPLLDGSFSTPALTINGATTAPNFISTVAVGTSPYACTSTTVNTNLNADLWDGYQFSDYLNQAVKTTSSPTFANITDSGITINHVVYGSTAGLLIGSANLTFSGSTLAITGNAQLLGTSADVGLSFYDGATLKAAINYRGSLAAGNKYWGYANYSADFMQFVSQTGGIRFTIEQNSAVPTISFWTCRAASTDYRQRVAISNGSDVATLTVGMDSGYLTNLLVYGITTLSAGVSSGTNSSRLILQNTTGASTGRLNIDWYNSVGLVTSTRLYSEVGTSYTNSRFYIDVADSSKVLQNRFNIDVSGYCYIGQRLRVGSLSVAPTVALNVTGNSVIEGVDANVLVLGSGGAGIDYTLKFDGETNDGILTWMEDEDYFKFADDLFLDKKITGYNNVVTEGYGVPAIVDHVALTAQGASIGSTNFTNAGAAGNYQINYYLEATTSNVGATTIMLTVSFTDDAGATTVASVALPLTALGRTSGVFYVQLASGNLSYTTTYIDVTGLSRYALYMDCERLN